MKTWLLLAGFLALCACTAAQDAVPAPTPAAALAQQTLCVKTHEPIAVDGALSEPAWRNACVVWLTRPGAGAPVQPVKALLLWDQQALYLGFECLDWDVRASSAEPESPLWRSGDCFEFFISPGKSGPPALIEVQCSPTGATTDLGYQSIGQSSKDAMPWNWPGASFKAKISGSLNTPGPDQKWSGELRLPWPAGPNAFIGPAKPGLVLRALLVNLNETSLPENRLSRETSTWPALSGEDFSKPDRYASILLVDSPQAGADMEGFARIIEGQPVNSASLIQDHRGFAPGWGVDARTNAIAWESPAVKSSASVIALNFTIQSRGPSGNLPDSFEIFINGKPVGGFTPHQIQSGSWVLSDGAVLEYVYKQGKFWPSGTCRLTLPAALAPPGQPVRITIKPHSGNPNDCQLILLERPDTLLFDTFYP
jgi:hypothetical protein